MAFYRTTIGTGSVIRGEREIGRAILTYDDQPLSWKQKHKIGSLFDITSPLEIDIQNHDRALVTVRRDVTVYMFRDGDFSNKEVKAEQEVKLKKGQVFLLEKASLAVRSSRGVKSEGIRWSQDTNIHNYDF